MDGPGSLRYYDQIFEGVRGPGFGELVGALADELEAYSRDASAIASGAGDAGRWATLRHDHRPLVRNLGLASVEAQESALKAALDRGDAPAIRCAAQALARATQDAARWLRAELTVLT